MCYLQACPGPCVANMETHTPRYGEEMLRGQCLRTQPVSPLKISYSFCGQTPWFCSRPTPGVFISQCWIRSAGLCQRGETVEKIGRLLPTVHSLQIPNAAGCSTSSLSTLWPFVCFLSILFSCSAGGTEVSSPAVQLVYTFVTQAFRLYFGLMGFSLIDW